MRTIRRARDAAVLSLFIVGTSCRDMAHSTGPGLVAPSAAALAFSSQLPVTQGEPLIPVRSARVRLFRLPTELPERAVLDSVIPFGDNDSERTFSVGLELSLLDDQQQVVYLARDTVVAYTGSTPPSAQPIRLRYVGADTAVTRVTLTADATAIPVGEPTALHAAAFLRDGRPIGARFGYAVHGSPNLSVDATGTVHASALVAPGSTWIVARIATGLADSVAVSAVVPAATVSISPKSGRVAIGDHLVLDAAVRDSSGARITGREPEWTSSDTSVATVDHGVVTGRKAGTAEITARCDRASASASVAVGAATVKGVVTSVRSLLLSAGGTAVISADAVDADGVAIPGRTAVWSVLDQSVAGLTLASTSTPATTTVRGLAIGVTTLVVEVDGVRASVPVYVQPTLAGKVDILPASPPILIGDSTMLRVDVYDVNGKHQPSRQAFWRSLDPTVASIGQSGMLHGLVAGQARIVAAVDLIADTVTVTVREVATLGITRLGSVIDQRGEVASFSIAATDQFGAPINNLGVVWSLNGGGTLLNRTGTVAQVVLQRDVRAVLVVSAGKITATLAIQGGVTPPTPPPTDTPPTPPVSPPSEKPPTLPVTPPREPKH